MIIGGEILLVLFFIYNMGRLIYDYLDDVREVKYMNMIWVVLTITGMALLNYIGMKIS